MMTPLVQLPRRYHGRLFTAEEVDLIGRIIGSESQPNRREISHKVCDALGWFRPNGRRKDMACRVALLRMERDGLIALPPPIHRNSNGKIRLRLSPAADPQEPLALPAGALGNLVVQPVETRTTSAFWIELMQRYHYLGYKLIAGAQIRYLVYSGPTCLNRMGAPHLLAALGFGASAWKVAPRDRFIGWSPEQRVRNLQRVVNNARFLIVPWVTSKNLASRILALIAHRLPQDWEKRYSYCPVLLETFVDRSRFRGTCYRAANWIHVGETQGRGKLDRENLKLLPVKDIYLYPLVPNFRQSLCQ